MSENVDFSWVSDIAEDTFTRGLQWIFDEDRARSAIRRWFLEADPVYLPLLSGIPEPRRRRFIADWRLAQTLATNCRFFMEETIFRILLHPNQKELFGRSVYAAYTHRDLVAGHLGRFPDITFMGDERKEWAMARGWDASIRTSALKAVDEKALEEDLIHDEIMVQSRNRADVAMEKGLTAEASLKEVTNRILGALEGEGSWKKVFLACNLVVVDDPRKGWVHAFRFINSRNASKKDVQADRKNYLRLLAYVHQEKFQRQPENLRVVICPLVERHGYYGSTHHLLRFTPHELWSSAQFWEFVRVPFEAVRRGIQAAGGLIPDLLERLASPATEGDHQEQLFEFWNEQD